MLKVFLVDDHEVVRRGVAVVLERAPDLSVIGQAGTAAAALVWVPATNPDVVVLDVRLPDGNGVELCRELRSVLPGLRCLMLTSFAEEQAMLDAIMAGAEGYVIKDILGMELVLAVRAVGAGRSMLDNRASAVLMNRLRRAAEPGAAAALTRQERRLLDLIGEGLSNRQIAGRLCVTEKTVKNYVSRVLAKLGMTCRTQAAVLATELRIRKHPRR